MALVTNRINSAAYARGTIVGGAEAWQSVRLNTFRNIYASEAGIGDKTGIPNGYNMGAILLPLKGGGMAIFQEPDTMTAVNADAKMGRPITASAALSIVSTNAQADQIVSLEASDSLAIAPDAAELTAGVEAEASSACTITPNASLGGIIPVSASGACSITPGITVSALAFMEAVAGGPTPLSPEGLSSELLDNQDVETGYSMREALRLILSSVAGKLSGAGTATVTIRSVTDGTNRIVATVDSNGNRTAVTYNVGDE